MATHTVQLPDHRRHHQVDEISQLAGLLGWCWAIQQPWWLYLPLIQWHAIDRQTTTVLWPWWWWWWEKQQVAAVMAVTACIITAYRSLNHLHQWSPYAPPSNTSYLGSITSISIILAFFVWLSTHTHADRQIMLYILYTGCTNSKQSLSKTPLSR